ncbi:uncharacterized protein LOC143212312 [Lasioglossum baleicum]|uniref:uncharacterized protein LOC143212312 n=1 Tax=Lasioglossum baleicum TaxID=434251 RepID=UPI003FCDA7CF
MRIHILPTLNMDNKITKDVNVIRKDSVVEEIASSAASIAKEIVKKSAFSTEPFDDDDDDEKDMLIAQLQEQISKQRECILYYESIVQLMNCRLMKLKKVLKAHELLEELDS